MIGQGLLTSFFLAFATTAAAAAVPADNRGHERERGRSERHLLLRAEHPLLPEERSSLEREGCRIVRELGERDYIVTVGPSARDRVSAKLFVRSVEPLSRERRVSALARREAARFGAMARLNVVFHDDVAFEQARQVIAAAGGWLESPLEFDFRAPRRLSARVPDDAINTLAAADEVFLIDGPIPPIKAMNSTAAELSVVTPLHSAPYQLTGEGVVVSVFDYGDSGPALADISHQEFGGRVERNGSFSASMHPTHVTGTIAAKGINARAAGMAPGVRVQNYAATDRFLDDKEDAFSGGRGIRADNNSWGYVHGWQRAGRGWEWYGATEDDPSTATDERLTDPLFGAYGLSTTALDQISRESQVLIVYAASNDNEDAGPIAPCFEHFHEDRSPKYCFSETGSATSTCTATVCTGGFERIKHSPDGPFGTVNLAASGKNVIAVGALSASRTIASFSARGPAQDGRIKPELVAKSFLYSTIPNQAYSFASGTSMAAPVVTGIAALIVEQWRRTMGSDPAADAIRVLLIHGAEDLGNPGPDYTYGYGLVNARNSVDTIIADGGSGSHIKSGRIGQGAFVEYALPLAGTAAARLTLGWIDPEGVPYATRPLVNDLDLKVIAPDGTTLLPLVLNPAQPDAAAAPGVNNRDNIEQITVAATTGGLYRVQVSGTSISTVSAQPFILASTVFLGPVIGGCVDVHEPNDTAETAFGRLAPGAAFTGRTCGANDTDFYRFVIDRSGPVSVTLTASDTPLRITLMQNGTPVQTQDVAPETSRTIETAAGTGLDQPIAPITYVVRIEPTGAVGPSSSYTLAVNYRFAAGRRQRITGR